MLLISGDWTWPLKMSWNVSDKNFTEIVWGLLWVRFPGQASVWYYSIPAGILKYYLYILLWKQKLRPVSSYYLLGHVDWLSQTYFPVESLFWSLWDKRLRIDGWPIGLCTNALACFIFHKLQWKRKQISPWLWIWSSMDKVIAITKVHRKCKQYCIWCNHTNIFKGILCF